MSDSCLSQFRISDESIVIKTGSMLDNSNATDMLDTISQAAENGYRRIVIEMGKLEFLSSAGVGSILGSVETVREMGGDIILCGLSPTIRHVLDVLDLSSYLTITTDQSSAITVALEPR